MRVLDEVAEAIRLVCNWGQPTVRSAVGLEELFGRPVTPREWDTIQKHLACPLPPLEFVQGHWFLPAGFVTIWDLVDCAAHRHPDWEPPIVRTQDAWREAQVFVGVRICLVEAGGLGAKDVVRSARLKRDLGLE